MMLNYNYSLALNQINTLAPEYVPSTYPGYLERLRQIFRLSDHSSAVKFIQAAEATELFLYLPRTLREHTLNFSSGAYIGDGTYPLPTISNILKTTDLQKLQTDASKFLDSSILNTLVYIKNTHFTSIYVVSAMAILWLFVADYYHNQ